jgi:hypothetical protein
MSRKQRPCWSVTKLASITFSSLAFSYWIDKSRFLIEVKTCYCSHHTFILRFPTGWLSCPHQVLKFLFELLNLFMYFCKHMIRRRGNSMKCPIIIEVFENIFFMLICILFAFFIYFEDVNNKFLM